MTIIVALSGPVSSGKSTLAAHLAEKWNGTVVSTREEIQRLARERSGSLDARRAFQEFGDMLDRETEGTWVVEAAQQNEDASRRLLVIDAVRIQQQVAHLRRHFGRRLIHVHLATNDREELARRYRLRRAHGTGMTELESYEAVAENFTELRIDDLGNHADVVLDTVRNTPQDLLVRCEARLGLLPATTAPLVDVIVGGQYGSEGKGNIAYYMAPEYDLLVRVGGPNAGHKVKHRGRVYTHRSLPSGALSNSESELVIGPGAVVNPQVLLEEISDTGVNPSRVRIDPNAMVVSPDDIASEAGLRQSIRSTAQGAGAAAARRILGRGAPPTLAAGCDELTQFIAPTAELLNAAFGANKRVLVEGTQGTGLSLYHGEYPWVTSRDTTVAGTLAEAGIGPRRVRRTVMVVRTYPIRVSGASGPIGTGNEVTWDDIEQRSGVVDATDTELSSVTKEIRRVAEFDWSLLRRSSELNSATDIALTFADYISVQNRQAYRYEQLTSETLQFVEDVENVSCADVSLISTDFSERSIIDRRTWRSSRE